jgi:hypothetical protein
MKAVVGEVCPASGEWMDLGVVGALCASTWGGRNGGIWECRVPEG